MQSEQVRELRRSEEETRVAHAEHQSRAPRCQHGMFEVERVAVKLFPVVLKNQRLQLLVQRRSRIRRQQFEVRARRAEFASEFNRGLDALFRIDRKSTRLNSSHIPLS